MTRQPLPSFRLDDESNLYTIFRLSYHGLHRPCERDISYVPTCTERRRQRHRGDFLRLGFQCHNRYNAHPLETQFFVASHFVVRIVCLSYSFCIGWVATFTGEYGKVPSSHTVPTLKIATTITNRMYNNEYSIVETSFLLLSFLHLQ